MLGLALPTRAPTLLDGGMGQELRKRGIKGPNNLWAAFGLLHHPEVVEQIHLDYLEAGADVITTNTYSTAYSRLKKAGSGYAEQFESLNSLACDLANRARDKAGRAVEIAGSLPPLDDSYRPDLVGEHDALVEAYAEHAKILAPHVDLMICETMSSAGEARAALEGARSSGKPVWISWSLAPGGAATLRSGENIAAAVASVVDLEPAAALFNCCEPECISAAMPILAALMPNLPVGGYANGFEQIPDDWLGHEDGVDVLGSRQDLGPSRYTSIVEKWLDSGASIVGGCCEIGPRHIARIREMIDTRVMPVIDLVRAGER